jgi:hypothetical protein
LIWLLLVSYQVFPTDNGQVILILTEFHSNDLVRLSLIRPLFHQIN